MAPVKKTKENPNNYHCRDCKYATDFHERDYKGEFFLCRCKFFQYSKFLNRDWCSNFKHKDML